MAAPLPVTVGRATVLPPLMLKLPEFTVKVGCGTSRLNELTPTVVEEIPPEVTIVAGAAEGNGTELPPLMLMLPELIVNVGCGTVTV
jgi:hypothetical protein